MPAGALPVPVFVSKALSTHSPLMDLHAARGLPTILLPARRMSVLHRTLGKATGPRTARQEEGAHELTSGGGDSGEAVCTGPAGAGPGTRGTPRERCWLLSRRVAPCTRQRLLSPKHPEGGAASPMAAVGDRGPAYRGRHAQPRTQPAARVKEHLRPPGPAPSRNGRQLGGTGAACPPPWKPCSVTI